MRNTDPIPKSLKPEAKARHRMMCPIPTDSEPSALNNTVLFDTTGIADVTKSEDETRVEQEALPGKIPRH